VRTWQEARALPIPFSNRPPSVLYLSYLAMSTPALDKKLPRPGKDTLASFYHISWLITPSDTEWTWSTTRMKKWEKIEIEEGSEDWTTSFCKYWRGPKPAIIPPDRPADLPYVLHLGTDLCFPPPMGMQIVVTKAYEDMFLRLLDLRMRDEGGNRGAVLTGQPGTGASMTRSPPCAATHRWIRPPGKTTFLPFMLARLVSAHQVVVYYTSGRSVLFYRGEVYTRSALSGFEDLPMIQGILYCPVWTLIDMDFGNGAPPIVEDSNIWPIQASLLNPIRWNQWRERDGAALLGMPLWSMEELIMGYAFALFPLLSTDPGHPLQWRFVADCPPLQLPYPDQLQLVCRRTGGPAQ